MQKSIAQEVVVLSSVQARELKETVSGCIQRKRAMLKELDYKSLKKIGQRQLSRIQQVIDREQYTTLPDVQRVLQYTEELSFGGNKTTLKNLFFAIAKEWNRTAIKEDKEAVYTEAILIESCESLGFAVLGKVNENGNLLFFAFESDVDALRKQGRERASVQVADVRKWARSQVETVSFEQPAPVEVRVAEKIEMMSTADAQAKARETEALVEANKMVKMSPEMKAAMAAARKAEHKPLAPIEAASDGPVEQNGATA